MLRFIKIIINDKLCVIVCYYDLKISHELTLIRQSSCNYQYHLELQTTKFDLKINDIYITSISLGLKAPSSLIFLLIYTNGILTIL
jgi:hypothetical protein